MMRALTAFFLLALVAAGASASDGPSSAAMLAASCTSCHAASDRPDGIPGLAGRDGQALLDLLIAYRDGSRPGTLMPRIAAGYSDDELRAIADYLAGP
jgi:sulfide dehydrogenase cytochrome subunit